MGKDGTTSDPSLHERCYDRRMRRELVVALIASALALFVYTGVTATDARVGTLITTVRTALESEMEIDAGAGGIFEGGHGALSILDVPVAIAFFILLFGGLPVAIFGLLFERQWKGVPLERRPSLRVPYELLMFQVVSMGFSALWLAVMRRELMWRLSAHLMTPSDWLLPAYLTAQILASITVIPAWRRMLVDVPVLKVSILQP
jgi:hypothetical protein